MVIKKLHYNGVFFFLTVIGLSNVIYARSAVTYEFSHGRMGDWLISLSHAKWIAYKYNIPFIYKPFHYSDQFTMHVNERHYSESEFSKYRKVVLNDRNIVINPKANILYIVPYFSESHFEPDFSPLNFTVDWTDRGFLRELRNFMRPRFSLASPQIPEGHISVAVHVRKGGGFDVANLTQLVPHKSPPDSFYIEQIKRLTTIFPGQRLYAFIFTDHDKPLELMEYYKVAINNENVVFACRETENAYNKNVVDDFFALTKFDCLIRPDSNFSLMASKLKDYKVQISPHSITRIVADKNKSTQDNNAQIDKISPDDNKVESVIEEKKEEIIIDKVRVEINDDRRTFVEIC